MSVRKEDKAVQVGQLFHEAERIYSNKQKTNKKQTKNKQKTNKKQTKNKQKTNKKQTKNKQTKAKQKQKQKQKQIETKDNQLFALFDVPVVNVNRHNSGRPTTYFDAPAGNHHLPPSLPSAPLSSLLAWLFYLLLLIAFIFFLFFCFSSRQEKESVSTGLLR